MMAHYSTRIWMAALLLITLTGCARGLAPSAAPSFQAQQSLHLFSGRLIHVSEPPPLDSPQFQLELAELHAHREVLTAAQEEAIRAWDRAAILRWNEIARDLVSKNNLDPLNASRLYMLLSIAQHDALRAAEENQRHYDRQMPTLAEGGVTPLLMVGAPASYPSEHAAIASASAAVLADFFPIDLPMLDQQRTEQQETRLWAGVNCRSDIIAGDALGKEIATKLLDQSWADLEAVQVWDGEIPDGAGKWIIDPQSPQLPAKPHWATLRPWLMERPDQFRAPPPPAFDSPAFELALQEVRQISDARTPEQVRIAQFWADSKGTPTPPGRWNQIAADLITEREMDDRAASQVLSYLNIALYDAGISAWDSKYTYWLIRPSHADPAITTPVRLPNHPSYTSGHATFSGAAAEFLSMVFPEQQAELQAMAEEASLSRVYGGIHYRFDGEYGLMSGRAIGSLAAERMHATP